MISAESTDITGFLFFIKSIQTDFLVKRAFKRAFKKSKVLESKQCNIN